MLSLELAGDKDIQPLSLSMWDKTNAIALPACKWVSYVLSNTMEHQGVPPVHTQNGASLSSPTLSIIAKNDEDGFISQTCWLHILSYSGSYEVSETGKSYQRI